MSPEDRGDYLDVDQRVIDVNTSALGAAWDQGRGLAVLHREALGLVANGAGDPASEQDQAVVLFASHGLNVYVSAMRELAWGRFDIAGYLFRPFFDAGVLMLACATNPDIAETLLEGGEYRAGRVRKEIVSEIRKENEAIADEVDRRWRIQTNTTHRLSHASAAHLDSLIESGNGVAGLQAVIGGRPDPSHAVRLGRVIVNQELEFLGWLSMTQSDYIAMGWTARLEELRVSLDPWILRRTEHPD